MFQKCYYKFYLLKHIYALYLNRFISHPIFPTNLSWTMLNKNYWIVQLWTKKPNGSDIVQSCIQSWGQWWILYQHVSFKPLWHEIVNYIRQVMWLVVHTISPNYDRCGFLCKFAPELDDSHHFFYYSYIFLWLTLAVYGIMNEPSSFFSTYKYLKMTFFFKMHLWYNLFDSFE